MKDMFFFWNSPR